MRKLFFGKLFLAVYALGGIASFSLLAAETEKSAPERHQQVITAFLATLPANANLTDEQKSKGKELVESLRADPDGQAAAVTEVLRDISPEYRQALTALGEENLVDALAGLNKLTSSADPYLAADAAYFAARALLIDERYEEALPLLDDLSSKWLASTLRDGEGLFLRGVVQGQLLQRDAALATLQTFLKDFPDAPERMRVGAFRQVESLKLYKEGTLSDVQLRMEFSRRKLYLSDTGAETKLQQEKIVTLLATLIKDAEEKECNCKGSGKGSKPGSGKKPGKGNEGESQAEGEGQGQGGKSGGGSKGIDTDTAKKLHRGGPQSPWSQLRDRERDPVFNAIKEKYPARYQQLIEQYYKSFQDESEG